MSEDPRLTDEIKDKFHPTRFWCRACEAKAGSPCVSNGKPITGIHEARGVVAAWAIDDHLSGSESTPYVPGERVPAR